MILYIAEKPSLGKAIAAVLPKPHKKQQGYIEVGNGDVVSWCIGHLLEQVPPDHYDAKYKSWRLEDLPIVPQQWQLQPKTSTKSQLTVLRGLVKKAKQIVHAGDPDREGQLLVDEVLSYLKVSQSKIKQAKRLLISDLNPQAVQAALKQQRMNQEFIPLSVSALARSRADWLYGMNLTRAMTLQGKKVGYQGVLSVGRVQTPLLGLVVQRDDQRQHFQSKPYFEVDAHLQTDHKQGFTARWQPSEACAPYQDEEGRVLSQKLADTVVAKISEQPATVNQVTSQAKQQAAPLLYSLSALQIDCSKRFGYSAKQVLDTCQRLYETHQLITYPRSDSRHLPKAHYQQAKQVLAAIANNAGHLIPTQQPNPSLKSKAWNDAKVDAHHAIVPTLKKANLSNLSATEQNVYQQIARQYLAQFYPAYRYQETQVEILIAGGVFKASSKQDLELGWKCLFPSSKAQQEENPLPPLKKGQSLWCQRGERLDKQTQPPKAFTDATLLSAMTNIARYVDNQQIKKTLKETDGLGTEATRASIIELLFQRGFLTRQGKTITATEIGQALIHSLPKALTVPDMTAQWEQSLEGMLEKQVSYQGFMMGLVSNIEQLLQSATAQVPTGLAGLSAPQAKSAQKSRKPTARRKK